MNKEKIAILDQVEWVHKDKTGRIIRKYNSDSWMNRMLRKLHFKSHQCIVASGMANMAGLMLTDVGGTAYDYIAIGSGTTPADVANTILQTQEGVRQLAVGTRIQTTQPDDTAQLVATFSQAIDATLEGIDAITEVGVFFHATDNPTMLMRQVFAAESLNWDAGDSIEFTVKIQIKQGT